MQWMIGKSGQSGHADFGDLMGANAGSWLV